MVIVGLLMLLAAVGVGLSGVLANSGSEHLLGQDFSVLGLQLSGLTTGQLFLYGIIIGVLLNHRGPTSRSEHEGLTRTPAPHQPPSWRDTLRPRWAQSPDAPHLPILTRVPFRGSGGVVVTLLGGGLVQE